MPPMITTISEFRRNAVSLPGCSEIIVPPRTPPKPASSAPSRKAKAKISCTLMPSAETMSRSSTPARTILPKRVFLMMYQSRAEHDHPAEEAEAHVAGQRDGVGPVSRCLDVLRDAAERGEHLVGEDH